MDYYSTALLDMSERNLPRGQALFLDLTKVKEGADFETLSEEYETLKGLQQPFALAVTDHQQVKIYTIIPRSNLSLGEIVRFDDADHCRVIFHTR
jgi:hypothetical protein